MALEETLVATHSRWTLTLTFVATNTFLWDFDVGFDSSLPPCVLFAQVHGDAIVEQPLLRAVAARLYRRLAPTWCRLDGLLSELRCAVGFFSNLQA